jgi:hypothetical protein
MKKYCLLSLFLLSLLAAKSQLTYKELSVQYDSAMEYKHLKIIPIIRKGPGDPRPQYLTLSKGIQSGLVTVSERGSASVENVHWLRINNNSKIPLFISSGEVIMGGRQDRMVAKDTILEPTGKDQYVSVMCVEEDRWSDKEKKFNYFNFANIRLRKVVDQSKNQVSIWREIYSQLDSNGVKSPTLAYAGQRLDKKALLLAEEYRRYFSNAIKKKKDSSWVGFVCVTGDRIIGCDIFDANNVFYDQFEALVDGYAEEAIYRGAAVSISDSKVKTYMDKILTDEKSQEAYLKRNGKIFKHDGKVFHITGFGE